MKKTLNVILIVSVLFTLGVAQISKAEQLQNPLAVDNIEDLFNSVLKFIFNLALVVAPLLIVIGGFYILTAAGNPARIETGRKIIIYTLIGFAIIFASRGLVAIIRDVIKATPSGSNPPPLNPGNPPAPVIID